MFLDNLFNYWAAKQQNRSTNRSCNCCCAPTHASLTRTSRPYLIDSCNGAWGLVRGTYGKWAHEFRTCWAVPDFVLSLILQNCSEAWQFLKIETLSHWSHLEVYRNEQERDIERDSAGAREFIHPILHKESTLAAGEFVASVLCRCLSPPHPLLSFSIKQA